MGRTAAHTDPFNAVAEPGRRAILDLLADGERPVNELVASLGVAQPLVSKRLRILRDAGVVEVRGEGRQRLYSVRSATLRPIHDWVKAYERLWSERFEGLDAVLADMDNEEGSRDAAG